MIQASFLQPASIIIALIILPTLCNSIHEQEWQPLLQPDVFPGSHEILSQETPSFPSLVAQSYQPNGLHHPAADQCELHKVGFKQDLYFQYIHYKVEIPPLKEFTLCYWAKYANHSNDHPLFSYAGKYKKLNSFKGRILIKKFEPRAFGK